LLFKSDEKPSQSHPAGEFVQSAHEKLPQADEYLIDDAPPTGALIKADNPKLVLEALKDGKARMTCSTWEDARVHAPGEMLGLRREGAFWVVTRITRCA
jgi:hypothetical protein